MSVVLKVRCLTCAAFQDDASKCAACGSQTWEKVVVDDSTGGETYVARMLNDEGEEVAVEVVNAPECFAYEEAAKVGAAVPEWAATAVPRVVAAKTLEERIEILEAEVAALRGG